MAYDIFMKKGLQAAFDAISSKDSGTLYFCTDTGNLYLGDKLYTGKVSTVKPASGVEGVLYLADSRAYVWTGGAYVALSLEHTTSIGAAPVDTKLPTEKAVADYVAAELAKFGGSDAIQDLKTRLATAEADIDALESDNTTNKQDIANLKSGKADKATTLAGYGIADAYTKTEADKMADDKIKAALTSALVYKGTVENYSDLPAADQKVGDVYNVTNADNTHGVKAGDNVAWNGTGWDVLAGTVDLSAYSTTAQVEGKIATAKKDAIDTAAADATSKANTAESNAKSYADSLAPNYATAAQGAKADTALQQADITEGSANGMVSVKGTDVAVHGLKSAAFTEASAYDVAGAAADALTQAKAYTNTALTWGSF